MERTSVATKPKTKAERREKKKRPRMRVSGRGAFLLQRIKLKKRHNLF